MAPPNRPHWTPALTISERSDIASISMLVTAPPASARSAVRDGETVCGVPEIGEDPHLFESLGARNGGVGCVVRSKTFVVQFAANALTHLPPASVECCPEVVRCGGHGTDDSA